MAYEISDNDIWRIVVWKTGGFGEYQAEIDCAICDLIDAYSPPGMLTHISHVAPERRNRLAAELRAL